MSNLISPNCPLEFVIQKATKVNIRPSGTVAMLDDIGITPIAYGADNTGVLDSTAAIQQAATEAIHGDLKIPPGSYKISETIVTHGNIHADGATLIYSGTGIALQVGNGDADVSASLNRGRQLFLPKITRSETAWNDGSIGVLIVNTLESDIYSPAITGFDTGAKWYGQGTGVVKNRWFPGTLLDNKIQCHVTADSLGWCNENTVIGGALEYSSAFGARESGARGFLMDNTANQINNWRVYGLDFEYLGFEYHIESYGLRCLWDWCRWETGDAGTPPRVWWRTGSAANVIRGGYGSTTIIPLYEATNLYDNILETTRKRMINSADPGGPFWLQNASSSAPCISLFEGPNDIAARAAGDYGAAIGARVFGFKAVADSFDRLQIECPTGAIYTGDALAEPGSGHYRIALQSTRMLLKLIADAFPRINISASDGAIFFGDGTADPTGAFIKGAGTDRLQFWSNGQLVAECSTDGDFHIYSVTDTESASTGALVVEGGIGIVGNARIGGTLRTTGVLLPIGGIGMGNTPSANTPFRIAVTANAGVFWDIVNTDSGSSAYAGAAWQSDAGTGLVRMHSSANGSFPAFFAVLSPSGGAGLILGALGASKKVSLQTNGTERVTVEDGGLAMKSGTLQMKSFTVATLPSTAGTGMVTGARCYVTDADSPTFLATLTGGGAVVCPAFYNGSSWIAA